MSDAERALGRLEASVDTLMRRVEAHDATQSRQFAALQRQMAERFDERKKDSDRKHAENVSRIDILEKQLLAGKWAFKVFAFLGGGALALMTAVNEATNLWGKLSGWMK